FSRVYADNVSMELRAQAPCASREIPEIRHAHWSSLTPPWASREQIAARKVYPLDERGCTNQILEVTLAETTFHLNSQEERYASIVERNSLLDCRSKTELLVD